MSNELIGILIALVAVGAALAGLILTTSRGLRQDMSLMRAELRQDIKQGEARLEGQINGVRGEMNSLRGEVNGLRGEINQLRERMSHLEGLLEGLREAITGRVASR